MKDRIKYLNLVLFLIAILGSVFFITNFFIDRYYVMQSMWLLFVMVVNAFIIMALDDSVNKYTLFFILFISIILLFYYLFIPFFQGDLITICLTFVFIRFFIENLKQELSLKISLLYSGLSILGFIEVLWGMWQSFHLLLVYDTYYLITGTFDNPVGFAICVSALSPFCLFLVSSYSKYVRVSGWIFLFLSFCSILLSGSRAGILAILSVLVVHFYIFYLKHKMYGQYKNQIMCAIVLIFGCVFLGLYYFKKDSADGRLLIWRVTWDMIKDSPLIGHGSGSFQAKYMLYQADYFRLYPNSHFAQLADNVSHPFNEFLKIAAEYGCLGLIILFFLIGKGIYIFKRNTNIMKYPVIESIIAIVVCACFSYPLKYPVTWGILGLAISVICVKQERYFRLHIPYIRYFGMGISLYFIFLLLQHVSAEMKWKKIVDRSFLGETEQVLPFYEQLRGELGTNGLFLYNYAAELHVMKSYDKSIELLTECILYWNDYDVQLLLADCYLQKEQYEKAEDCFVLASNMCPNRFIPLYQLVHLYDRIGQKEKAYDLAEKIIHKTVKISSFKVQRIKNEMIEYVQKGI